jgi:hypothetical protein
MYFIHGTDQNDTIINGIAGGTMASGQIDTTAANHNQLWFVQSGNNLVMDVLGTSQTVVIQDWYSGSGSAQLQQIVTSDGFKMGDKIQDVVQAMHDFSMKNADFSPASGLHTTLVDNFFAGSLTTTLSTAWSK